MPTKAVADLYENNSKWINKNSPYKIDMTKLLKQKEKAIIRETNIHKYTLLVLTSHSITLYLSMIKNLCNKLPKNPEFFIKYLTLFAIGKNPYIIESKRFIKYMLI